MFMRKKALFWEKNGDNIKCLLCPNYCLIPEGKAGLCRSRINHKNILYADNFGRTISMNLDPMRKKPLYHFYPNDYILSLGANSCNLTCQFCQNYTSSQIDCGTMYISPEALKDFCLTKSILHVAFTYTEPFTWFEYIYEAASLLNKNNISVVLVTNGYVNSEPLMMLLPYISALNIDLKAFSEKFYKEICGGHLEPVLKTIKIAQTKHIEITYLMIESLNDDLNELHDMFVFIRDLNPNIPLHISKYFPRYKMNIKETDEVKLYKAAEIAKTYLNHVYLGNVTTKL